MKLSKLITSSVFQLVSLIFVLVYLLGILNIHFSDKNDYCEMTYMFEYPQFVRISLPENKVYPQYGLYAYSEGRFTERARKMWFDGVPVLYLPGNSGSYMQARSLASVALRKALTNGYDYHFDYFTISYNEELSGLYGGVLQSQTDFAAACVSKILSLYKNNKYTKSVPTSVIVIGHSMGGLIAKRLLAYSSTINHTMIAIALAAPLEAPVINFDIKINDYYMLMNMEWQEYIMRKEEMKQKKILISFGNGPRDVLMPSSLIFDNNCYINSLVTAVPGVWVSPDHVSIVWCKQFVMVINRFLFSIIDMQTEQVAENEHLIKARAEQYFQANRAMILTSKISRANITMYTDAFWYEDNRRIYQITRPEISKTTYLMIRLVSYPQNRFVAVESVNVDDKDWIFGCNAKYVYNTYRYCKYATSLTELSHWTGVADDYGRRKLATVHLHNLIEQYPDWTHVIVKVSPTRKPVVLNVDINDHSSRQIIVDLPSDLSFGKHIIKQETELNSLYYELVLPGFNKVHQAYLLYVEPTAGCKATQYHVSAEVHVPWAKNHEYYHYFTHSKQSPMKLRLFRSNPNVTSGLDLNEHVKVTLLMDPQCTYTISISSTWYHRVAQFTRNYTPVLFPYVAAIVLLACKSNIMHMREHGTFISIHNALMSESVKPYYVLVFARLGTLILMSTSILPFLLENASWKNLELQYFTCSVLVLPAYMIALGILNIIAAATLAVMVFSSQLAHRLLFRIVWRGGTGLAERVAVGLQKVPMFVSAALICAAPLSCGAASLATGAAFYAFMLSKMYEEYLEDYVYKIMAKFASRICRFFKFKSKDSDKESENTLVPKTSLPSDENTPKSLSAIDNKNKVDIKESKDNVNIKEISKTEERDENIEENISDNTNDLMSANVLSKENNVDLKEKCEESDIGSDKKDSGKNVDEDLNKLNFHMMLFFMWMIVTVVNLPALLTWARNFKYSMVLKPDTSYHCGLIMSVCSTIIWQMDGPRKKLKRYENVEALLFTMAVCILALGPLSLTIVNYGVTFMFATITIQQLCDKEEIDTEQISDDTQDKPKPERDSKSQQQNDENVGINENKEYKTENPERDVSNKEGSSEECDVCNETRIYSVFKNLRDKFSLNEEL